MRIALPIVLLIVGCTTQAGHEQPSGPVISYSFTNGWYADALISAFGDDVKKSEINFFVLPNLQSPVEPNGLSINRNRVRYVETVDGARREYDLRTSACAELAAAVDELYEHLSHLIPYATGDRNFRQGTILDGPDYVLEIHGQYADLLIEVEPWNARFPLVRGSEHIIGTLKEECG